MLERINRSVVDLKIEEVARLVEDALNASYSPNEVLEALKKGMEEVGEKFESGEYFVADLVMAGETMKEALAVLKPYLKSNVRARGKIVLGTIEGDLHDIGKDIVLTLLTSAGFEVYDLGIDVPPRRFVEKAKEVGADVIGVSSLLSSSVPRTARVVEELRKSGIRNRVKVIIGGAAVTQGNVKEFGVDAAVSDAIKGINIIKSWVAERE